MDSPESNKIVASSSSLDSPAVQESPFFNYLRTLSPIKSVKAAAHVAQGFSELNIPTPPPVFTSPRLNPHSETVFLKRSKFSQSSNAKLSIEHEDRGQTFGAGSDVSEQNIRRLTVGLAPCTQKACDTKDSLQIQLHSPSRFVDEYLADPIEVADVNSSDPSDSCLNQVVNVPETLQSGHINSKETTVEDGDGDGNYIMKYMEIGSDAQIVSSGRTDESLQGESVSSVEPGKVKEGNGQHVEYPDLMSNKINDISLSESSLEPVSGEQNVPNVENQAQGGQEGKRDNDAQVLPRILETGRHPVLSHESLANKITDLEAQGGQEGKRDNDAQVLPRILETGRHPVLSHESLANKITDLEETGQNQRGSRRRCLQFEASAARRKFISSNCVLNPAISSHCSKAPANPTDLEMLESVHLNGVTSRSKHTVNSSQPISKSSPCLAKTQEANISKFDRSVRNGGNSSMKAPLPSGIGLHLNSIVNTASMSCSGSGSIISAENDRPSVQNEKSLSVTKLHISEEVKTSPMPATVAGKNSANHHENPQIQSLTAENFSTSQVPYGNADKYQDFNQVSPINKRKRAYTVEEEGCKRCNCRRSKCLKLYCECFAAGIYCAEPCACQECFNKPEYEDMVLGTRHQIESRNPLAFAPKIIRRVTDSPVNSGEDNNKVTPSSARHKRGCNCKKSMCLKKYCECYQSGVGCSNGCRCEGCKNTFGIKEGYGEISGIISRKVNEESLEDLSVGKLAMETRNSVVIHSEHRHPHNLTPLTPSVQSSSNGKDMAKSRLPGRCLPSPESDSNGFSAYAQSPSSPGNLDIHDKQGRRAEGNLDIVFDQELEFSVTGKMDQFSPKWDRFEDIYNMTPLAHAPPKAVANLSPSNSRDCAKVSRVQLQGSVRLSGSLRWRSSPIAPMPRLGGSKLRQEVDSDIGYDLQEDDTPDILKDTPSPVKTVKASSPNQKRVSPPHGHLHSLTSSSSPGLRNGRKFVLQSISSFPSLTPYSDPKDSSSNG